MGLGMDDKLYTHNQSSGHKIHSQETFRVN